MQQSKVWYAMQADTKRQVFIFVDNIIITVATYSDYIANLEEKIV